MREDEDEAKKTWDKDKEEPPARCLLVEMIGRNG